MGVRKDKSPHVVCGANYAQNERAQKTKTIERPIYFFEPTNDNVLVTIFISKRGHAMIEKIVENLNRISDESIQRTLEKAKEFGLNLNSWHVPLDESLHNLSFVRNAVKDSIEKNEIKEFPITVQMIILEALENINKYFLSLSSGTDEVSNLGQVIEKLHATLFQWGIYHRSKEILGYEGKLNQIKNLELELSRTKSLLDDSLSKREALVELEKEFAAFKEAVALNAKAVSERAEESRITSEEITKSNLAIAAIVASAQQNENAVDKNLASSKASTTEISAIENNIKNFFKEISAYKTSISETTSNAESSVNQNKKDTEELVKQLNELEGQIKDQIEKATGRSLFHSFQKRKEEIVTRKNFWVLALGAILLVSLLGTFYIAKTETALGLALYLKLSFSIPIIYGISFCTVQYTKERKLEEEYAFKSNISISLVPYRDLVEKMIGVNDNQSKSKFADFMIGSISKIFTSPTEGVFHSEDSKNSEGGLKDLGKGLEAVLKPLEPIMKLLKH
jgi:methyl-accepting chemotaxis protein